MRPATQSGQAVPSTPRAAVKVTSCPSLMLLLLLSPAHLQGWWLDFKDEQESSCTNITYGWPHAPAMSISMLPRSPGLPWGGVAGERGLDSWLVGGTERGKDFWGSPQTFCSGCPTRLPVFGGANSSAPGPAGPGGSGVRACSGATWGHCMCDLRVLEPGWFSHP